MSQFRAVFNARMKTGALTYLHFDKLIVKIREELPRTGPLFQYLITVRPGDRATKCKQLCVGLGIENLKLHSYRYAWAKRARTCGYPERLAQRVLGHNSKTVRLACVKKWRAGEHSDPLMEGEETLEGRGWSKKIFDGIAVAHVGVWSVAPDCALEREIEVFRNAGQFCVNFLRMSPQCALMLRVKRVAGQLSRDASCRESPSYPQRA